MSTHPVVVTVSKVPASPSPSACQDYAVVAGILAWTRLPDLPMRGF